MTVTGEALQIISTSEHQRELEELIDWLTGELAEAEIEPTELQWTILINHLNEMLKRSKGQEAIPEAGGRAVVVPGMGADMRLGDVMQQEKADMGISFCGSGGAGALTAATKYGYPERHGMRSIEEGVTAINDGKTVLGFGFMDQEELGKRLVEAFEKKHN